MSVVLRFLITLKIINMGTITRHINRIIFINYLIRRNRTEDLETLANKKGISKSTRSAIILEMKSLGFPIKFNRKIHSYFYEGEGEMIKSLFLKYGEVLSRKEMQHVGNIEELCFSEKAVFQTL